MKIQNHILNAFIRHAKAAAPLEACALLAGNNEEMDTIYLMTNVDASPVHYTLDPEEQFFVKKHVRNHGKKLLGVIHSHPETPARPSAEDKRLAFQPGFTHLIVSLAAAQPKTKAFIIENGVSREIELTKVAEEDAYRRVDYPRDVWQQQRRFIQAFSQWQTSDWNDVRNKAVRVRMGVYEQRTPNTYMVRARIPSGVISASQLAGVCEAAMNFGDGTIHLTTRQSMQIHNIPRDHVSLVLEALMNVKIITIDTGGNSVRNIITCPGAGHCAHQVIDVVPYALALGDRLIKSRHDVQLPRKFKIGFSGCANDCAGAATTDLGFVAKLENSKSHFEVYAAGGLGSRPSLGLMLEKHAEPQDVGKVALALMSLFAQNGQQKNKRTARLRHLKEKVGPDKLTKLYQDALAGLKTEASLDVRRRSVFNLTGKAPSGDASFAKRGVDKGSYQLTFRPMLGILDGTRGIELAQMAKRANAVIHLSHLQAIGLHGVAGEQLQRLHRSLQKIQPEWSSPSMQKQPVVCAGTSVCKQGMCHSRALHAAYINELSASKVRLPKGWPQIRISGCPNSCAAHQIATLGLQGGARRVNGKLVPVYDFFLRKSDVSSDMEAPLGKSIGYLPARIVPGFLVHLAKQMTRSDHSFDKLLVDELALYQRHNVRFDNSEIYHDIGQCHAFSLDERSKGECSIGVIDVIEADLLAAERFLTEFVETAQPEKLYNSALAAARALLITRGESCVDGGAVARAFIAHFIHTGLANADLLPLINQLTIPANFTAGVNSGTVSSQSIQRFIEAVRALYKRMDERFNFTDAKPVPAVSSGINSQPPETAARLAVELDLAGVACPMNFVKAKLALEKLPIGATLKIILDDGAPIKNVPVSFRSQGQHVTDVTSLGNGTNLLVVQRTR